MKGTRRMLEVVPGRRAGDDLPGQRRGVTVFIAHPAEQRAQGLAHAVGIQGCALDVVRQRFAGSHVPVHAVQFFPFAAERKRLQFHPVASGGQGHRHGEPGEQVATG